MNGRIRKSIGISLAIVILLLLTTAFSFAVSKCDDGEHQYIVSIEKYATANEDGVRKYTCKICGDSYTEPIPATGHKYVEKNVPPTCTEAGKKVYTCSQCGDTYSETYGEALGHDYEVSSTAATCTSAGLTTYTCKRCGYSYSERRENPTGHKWGKWIVDKEPTTKKEGHKYRVCENDSKHREEKTIPVLKKETNTEKPQAKDYVVTYNNTSKTEPFGTADAVIIGANGISFAFFALLLIPYFKVLIWVAKKKKEKEEENDN